MATITVEDGSIVSGANSYVSEVELTTYATDRGVTLTGSTDELLIKAMDYLDQQNFIGTKKTDAQPLQWPRSFVWIDGYSVDSDEIPTLLKNVQTVIAVEIDAGYDPLLAIPRKVKREKVASLEVEYADGSASKTITPTISNVLKKLVARSSTSVFRA